MNRELNLNAKSIHEAIELQVKKEGFKPKPVKPLVAPVLAKPHTAVYKMHRYYARRPHNVFAKLIEHYTNPGDIVLDPFCGGGVTVFEGLKLRRRVIGIDINPLATWITKVEVEPVDFEILEELYNEWLKLIEKNIPKLFKAKCTECGKFGIAEWYEWSNVVVCPNCEENVILGRTKKIRPGLFECNNKQCKTRIQPNKCERKPDIILTVMIDCKNCKKVIKRESIPDDIKRYKKILKDEKQYIKKEKIKIPNEKFPDMDRARDDNIFGKGIKYFKDMMTVRQRISLGLIKRYLPRNKEANEIDALYHVFSASLRYVNKFVFQSSNWQSGKPIEWAGHNYWMPFCYFELNPLNPIKKKYKALINGKIEQEKFIGEYCKFPKSRKPWDELENGLTCWILTQSSHDIKLPDESVDAIITDPPFGGNVQYGELSDFYLVWLKEFLGLKNLSDKSMEAIETRNQGFKEAKDREFYEEMLYLIFKECRRVIKPDGWMVLTFHNRDIGVWMSLHRAALRAGFRLPLENECSNRGMVYQPPVQNYTQTIHQRAAGSMLGDFILSFKPAAPPVQLEAIKAQLTLKEEKELQDKAEEIIRYHGGADDTTLMTGLIPYLHEASLLHRIGKYDLNILLENGPFKFLSKEKKWFMEDMVEPTGSLKPLNMIDAEVFVQNLIHSYLFEHKQATMDELLVVIYENLVNSHRPQISTIDKVVNKYCKKKKVKGQKRELYIWNPKVKTPEQIEKALSTQIPLGFDTAIALDHNNIIKIISESANNAGYNVHVGKTEQRKSPTLKALSLELSGFELGLPPEVFKLIQEIDIIILKGSNIIAAVEVATTISTFNKAVNDRFRNLLTIAPNLDIRLSVIVSDNNFEKAHEELYTPANIKSRLSEKVKLFKTSKIMDKDFLNMILSKNT